MGGEYRELVVERVGGGSGRGKEGGGEWREQAEKSSPISLSGK